MFIKPSKKGDNEPNIKHVTCPCLPGWRESSKIFLIARVLRAKPFLFSKMREHCGGIVAMEAQPNYVQCGRKENRVETRQMDGL